MISHALLLAVVVVQTTAIERVNVIDVSAGRVLPEQTVVIESGRISAVGAAATAHVPSAAQRVDGRGRFLIPGLWDMHVHAAYPGIDAQFAPLFIANGVTGVREMFGNLMSIKAWKARAEKGEWPRIVGSGHIMDGSRPIWPGSVRAANADQARRAVDSLHKAGADFIKVYNRLPRDAYFAAVEEAKRVGTYVAGHVPDAVTVTEAAQAGQRTMEHVGGIALDCSSLRDDVRRARVAAAIDSTLARAAAQQSNRVADTQDAQRCAEVIATAARSGMWQVPTLVVLRSMASLDDSTFTADPRLRYMNRMLTNGWNWRSDFRLRARTPEDWAIAKRGYKLNFEIVRNLHRAGARILAGTDVMNPFAFPGFSLHDELALLVEAGLSPADALRAATLNPALFLEATELHGTVAAGKRADLVLLDANPLDDIRNTQKIRAVVVNGRYLDRASLDAMLAAAEKAAAPPMERR